MKMAPTLSIVSLALRKDTCDRTFATFNSKSISFYFAFWCLSWSAS